MRPVDFTGQRVGVIGTGSSGIQSVPVIAEQASHLTVFQRTANFSIPARNARCRRREREWFRAKLSGDQALRARGGAQRHLYRAARPRRARRRRQRAPRQIRGALGARRRSPSWRSTTTSRSTRPPTTPPPISSASKIAEIVKDPETAKLLQPNNHPIGSKRICIDTDYFATFNRPNVTLVDIKANPIEEITANAVRAAARITRSTRWCWRPASMR